MKNKDILERLNYIMEKEGLSQLDMAAKLGISQPNLSNILSGKRPFGKNMQVRVAKEFNVDENWLLTGEGEIIKKENNSKLTTEESPALNNFTVKDLFKNYYSNLDYKKIEKSLLEKQLQQLTEDETIKIANTMSLDYKDFENGIEIITNSPNTGKLVPVYNAVAAAGNGNIELYGVREGWINVGDMLKDSEGSLYVYGNSMIPGYPPGCLLGIRPHNEVFIEPGSVYVIQTESNRYVKRLYYNKENTAFVCLSDNHIKHTDGPMEGEYLYPPFEIPFSSVKTIYSVTGVIKRNTISKI